MGISTTAATTPRSYWQMVWHHFKKKRLAVTGLWVSLLLFFVAIFAPLLANDRPLFLSHQGQWFWPVFSGAEGVGPYVWKDLKKNSPFMLHGNIEGRGDVALWPPVPYSPTEYDLLESLAGPTRQHWLGTDDSGRDVLSRMIHGSRISLSVGFVAVSIALVIGIFLGSLAGYFGRWVDQLISRIIEVLLTIPTFFLIIAIIAFFPRAYTTSWS